MIPEKIRNHKYSSGFKTGSEKLLMAPLTLSVDVKSSSASAPDVSNRVVQIPQIKKSKGFASVSTQNENENPFDFFRTLFEGFIAGGTAGVVVETALYPIDTIKTRLQATRGGGKIVLKGLYSGLAGNIAGVLPASALFVGVYEPTKQKLLKTFPDHLSAVAHLTAGAIGGLAASLIRVPTEVVKQRMQTGQFASAPNAVRVIASQEGFKGLYAIPCIHAIAAAKYIKRDENRYVDTSHLTETWAKAYAESIHPGGELSTSTYPANIDELSCPPPATKKRSGRPPTKRKRSVGEFGVPGSKSQSHKCSRCGTGGHNKITCKRPTG
ncbi:hypothetical protein F2Q70_00012850 [Brassica cretica]|uniref:CCHC-type domain-containing protein n=1 Tax=Brassica cretica TaxID=69181 RepID=A0A8S9LXG5_BRACR|nr:hypothetical protein F2Q70_00012850 [Brassica cretica]